MDLKEVCKKFGLKICLQKVWIKNMFAKSGFRRSFLFLFLILILNLNYKFNNYI
jgi:hypothetical protein